MESPRRGSPFHRVPIGVALLGGGVLVGGALLAYGQFHHAPTHAVPGDRSATTSASPDEVPAAGSSVAAPSSGSVASRWPLAAPTGVSAVGGGPQQAEDEAEMQRLGAAASAPPADGGATDSGATDSGATDSGATGARSGGAAVVAPTASDTRTTTTTPTPVVTTPATTTPAATATSAAPSASSSAAPLSSASAAAGESSAFAGDAAVPAVPYSWPVVGPVPAGGFDGTGAGSAGTSGGGIGAGSLSGTAAGGGIGAGSLSGTATGGGIGAGSLSGTGAGAGGVSGTGAGGGGSLTGGGGAGTGAGGSLSGPITFNTGGSTSSGGGSTTGGSGSGGSSSGSGGGGATATDAGATSATTITAPMLVPISDAATPSTFWPSIHGYVRPGDLVVGSVRDASTQGAFFGLADQAKSDAPLAPYAIAFDRPALLEAALSKMPATLVAAGLSHTDGIDDATLAKLSTRVRAMGRRMFVSVTAPATSGPTFATIGARADFVEIVVPSADAAGTATAAKTAIAQIRTTGKPIIYVRIPESAVGRANTTWDASNTITTAVPGVGVSMPWSDGLASELAGVR